MPVLLITALEEYVGKIFPVLNVVPSSEVAVCVVASLFFQITVVPVLMVRLAGVKAMPAIVTVAVVPPGGVVTGAL